MIFSNNGERCTAGSRILVQKSIYADFAARFADRAKRITIGDPLDDKTIVGPMISPQHLAKVRRYIELGPSEGATLLCGGLDAPQLPAHLRRGNYVMPTVFGDVDNRMAHDRGDGLAGLGEVVRDIGNQVRALRRTDDERIRKAVHVDAVLAAHAEPDSRISFDLRVLRTSDSRRLRRWP